MEQNDNDAKDIVYEMCIYEAIHSEADRASVYSAVFRKRILSMQCTSLNCAQTRREMVIMSSYKRLLANSNKKQCFQNMIGCVYIRQVELAW